MNLPHIYLFFPNRLIRHFIARFIPEFIGRLPSITSLAPLTISDLRKILTEVKGSLVSQYTSLFGYSGIEIRFTSAAIDEICQKAFERGGGARGLRGIMVSHILSLFVCKNNWDLRRSYSWTPCMKHRKQIRFRKLRY